MRCPSKMTAPCHKEAAIPHFAIEPDARLPMLARRLAPRRQVTYRAAQMASPFKASIASMGYSALATSPTRRHFTPMPTPPLLTRAISYRRRSGGRVRLTARAFRRASKKRRLCACSRAPSREAYRRRCAPAFLMIVALTRRAVAVFPRYLWRAYGPPRSITLASEMVLGDAGFADGAVSCLLSDGVAGDGGDGDIRRGSADRVSNISAWYEFAALLDISVMAHFYTLRGAFATRLQAASRRSVQPSSRGMGVFRSRQIAAGIRRHASSGDSPNEAKLLALGVDANAGSDDDVVLRR